MVAMDSLQNSENPDGSDNFSDHTMVYIDLKTTGFGINTEVVQIGAHFAENSFSRYVNPSVRYLCPSETFGEKTEKQTYISQKDGILYLGGEQVETVSKTDAWKDFLKFLQSANNRVVLVTYHKFNGSYTLLRDLIQLSLMVQFRKVCAGVVDTLPVCKHVFPGRNELGKNYSLRELVKDVVGEEISPYDATVRARSLEKLMKHANVQPEMLQQHFSTLSDMEYHYHLNRVKSAKKLRSSRKKTNARTLDVNKQAKMMTTKDSLQNNENPNGSHHFADHTMVYWGLLATGVETRREVYQIGAHFAEKSFSRYVCPTSTLTHKAAKRTGLSTKDGILYLGEERVDTVSKTDAWKDFLKFLQSANNSVVLVTHNRSDFYSLLFRDLSELSLMEDFRKVCVGLIDTRPLCQDIFPPRNAFGRNYRLEGLVEDELGEETSSGHYNATVNAINLEKLMKYAKVDPETFQQHFFSLADLEYRYELKRKNLLRKAFKKEARARMMSSMETGEDSITSLLSGRRNQRANRKKTSPVTPNVGKQAEETTAKDSPQDNEDSNGIENISDHTMVYIDLKSAGSGKFSEICEIGAHFAENSFLRYVRPNGTSGKAAAKQSGLFEKDGIFYLGGERVETVSKMDAWKAFLEFLQSANNSVVLVIHERHNYCSLMYRDMSELSLLEKFRKVCVGVIYTLPLCKEVYPGRWKIGMDYGLKELVQDRLGEEDSVSGYTTAVNAINLERLMKHANVKPEMFQQHFLSLSKIESQTDRWQRRLQRKEESKARRLNSSSKENGEDSSASLLSGRMEATIPETNRMETSAVTPNVSKQADVCKNRWLGAGSAASAKPTKWALQGHLNFLEDAEYGRKSMSYISCQSHAHETEQETSTGAGVAADNMEGGSHSDQVRQASDCSTEKRDESSMSCIPEMNLQDEATSKEGITSPQAKRLKTTMDDRIINMLEKRQSDRERVFAEWRNERQMVTSHENDTDVFFRSMAMSMKKFHPTLLAEAKKRICNVVMELEVENENMETVRVPKHFSPSLIASSSSPAPSNQGSDYCSTSPQAFESINQGPLSNEPYSQRYKLS